MISFQEVLQDPRWNYNAKCSLNFHPCCKVLLLQMMGGTLQGEIQVRVTQACCLEYKCEWSTDCLLPNWKCSVGIYWHGISFLEEKNKRETWLHIFFLNPCCDFYLISFFFLVIKSWLFYLNLSFFIYWSERHFKGIIIIYWCNLIGATCFMAPVKVGFHSFGWLEPRTAYRERKAG